MSNVWKNPPNYGTYKGERGSPEQWKAYFNTAWDRETVERILDEDSPYGVLGLEQGASLAEIKKAFKKLMIIHHPDKGGDTEKARKIIAAYVYLTE